MIRLLLVPIVLLIWLAPGALAEQAVKKQTPESRTQVTLSFAPVVRRTRPAVVNVFADRIVRNRSFSAFGNDPLFRRFFGGDDFRGRRRERVKKSLGSGVIVDGSGIIVTNYHVIRNGNDIRVVLSDRREFHAIVLLKDERTDLAVLRIDTKGEDLPSLPLGDSDALEIGDLVLAIGNPFGVGQTVTSGIVSALARTRVGISSYQFFIQTDAAINPGNSGGALVNMAGELVGINTAIYSRSGGSLGIGFAIPVNMVRSVVASARSGSRVVRAWSGIEVQEVTSDIAESFGMKRPQGALITAMHPQSPLVGAGLQRGDIIASINGKEIVNAREFAYRFATIEIGKQAKIVYLRHGKAVTIEVTTIAPPGSDTPLRPKLVKGRSPFSGLKLADLSPALAEELNVRPHVRGVAIVGLGNGIAAGLGVFRKGDVIVEMNRQPIRKLEDFRQSVIRANGVFFFKLNRKGRTIPIRLGN